MKKLIPVVAIFLTGCTTIWEHPTKTESQFYSELSECERYAASQYPTIMQQMQITSGYTTPISTQCYAIGYNVQCHTIGGQYYPPVYQTLDINTSTRNNAVKICLRSQGWTPKK